MTEQEKKEIIRVCGKDYDYWDIPPAIRKRDEEEERTLNQQEEEYRQEEMERKKEYPECLKPKAPDGSDMHFWGW